MSDVSNGGKRRKGFLAMYLDARFGAPEPRKSAFFCGNCTSGDRRCVNPRCPGYGKP